MSGTTGEKKVNVISFDGKPENYEIWSTKQMAKWVQTGHIGVVDGTVAIPVASQAGPLSAEEEKAKKLNLEAFTNLLLSIDTSKVTGRSVFRMVKSTKSSDYPNGNVKEAMEKLARKFNPKTVSNRSKLKEQYTVFKIKGSTDPERAIEYLEDLRDKRQEAGDQISEQTFMMDITNKLPFDLYELEVKDFEAKLDAGTLDLEYMTNQLGTKFNRLKMSGKITEIEEEFKSADDHEESEEKGLSAMRKQFKGTCFKCGKMGHKSVDCRSSGGGGRPQGKKFHGQCFQCGKWGHRKSECKENGKKMESASTAVDREEEVALSVLPDEILDSEGSADGEVDISDEDSLFEWDHQEATEDESPCKSAIDGIPDDFFDSFEQANDDEEVSDVVSDEEEEEKLSTVENVARESCVEVESSESETEETRKNGRCVAETVHACTQGELVGDHKTEFFLDDDGEDGDDEAIETKIESEETPEEATTRAKDEHTDEVKNDEDAQFERLAVASAGEISLRTVQRARNDFGPNTWIGDTGASTHMGPTDDGMENVRSINEAISVGDGKPVIATKIGDKRVMVEQPDGTFEEMVLKDYMYAPGLRHHLLSLTKPLMEGWKLSSDGLSLILSKGKYQIVLNKHCRTRKGLVIGVDVGTAGCAESANPSIAKGKCDINEFHRIFGHHSEDTLRRTAKKYGIKLTGKLKPCEACRISNAKQKNVPKVSFREPTTKPGELVYIDISSIKSTSYGGNKFWLAFMDDYTEKCWSFFLKKKSDQVEVLKTFLTDMKAKYDFKVETIRCDNAGENKSLEETLKKGGFGIKFEYTAPGSPQFNGKIERKFATLMSHVRAQNEAAGLSGELRDKLWCEGARHATDIDGIMIGKAQENTPYERMFKEEAEFVPHLRQFGEMAVVKALGQDIKSKLTPRGRLAIYLGRAESHAPDCHRFLAVDTKRVILSRDVMWLGKTYGKWKTGVDLAEAIASVPDDDDDENQPINNDNDDGPPDDENEENNEEENNENDNEETGGTAPTHGYQTRRRGLDDQVAQEMTDRVRRELGSHNNPGLRELPVSDITSDEDPNPQSGRESARSVMEDWNPEYSFASSVPDFAFSATNEKEEEDDLPTINGEKIQPSRFKDVFTCPKTFRQAWDHPDPWQRERWRAAIRKEFLKMNRNGVWRKIKRRDIPSGRRCVKHKWVLEIKRNGIFRARLVACGYSQIPGVDFTEFYAPVLSDVAFRVLLTLMLVNKYDAMIMDVETAFLHGELEEEIFMDCPEGLEDAEDDDALQLVKTIYGLVQSSRAYYKKFVERAKSIGCVVSQADPCVLVRRTSAGVVYIGMYVDDCLLIGDRPVILETIELIKKTGFNVTVEGALTDYLSCEIRCNEGKTKAWIGQPHLIKKIKATFGDLVSGMPKYMTPGTPNKGIIRPSETDAKLSIEEQKVYRSGVGMLLYLVKHSRPDIANAVRELSKVMDGATNASKKELFRVIKYVIDTENLGLKIEPIMDGVWKLVAYSDSDWAGDKDNRRSVSGYVIFFCGVPVLWRSRAQKSVSLSSSEGEFYALAETAKEVKFIANLLLSIGIKVELPIVLHVDNVGAIFMTENASSSERTKHIDTRYWFVREMSDEGFVKVVFVPTKENKADTYTKNVTSEIHTVHCGEYVVSRVDYLGN